jgi:glycerophosphoryl diester phosphodiesterase
MLALFLVAASPGCLAGEMTDRPHATKSRTTTPIVIGHRGASGYRPEHTLASYELAIAQGADFIEPDLVVTRDGVLVARHENEISGTTDVAAHPEFAGRRTTKRIDGEAITGWFAEDFTLAEIKSLRARERIPLVRPDNARFDGQFEIPTFAEVIELAARSKRPVGIYPETKHPTYFAHEGRYLDGSPIGRSLGRLVVSALVERRFTDPNRVFIQSFEVANLVELKRTIMPAAGVDLPLVQLFGDTAGSRQPYDIAFHAARGDDLASIYGELARLVPGGITGETRYRDLATGPALAALCSAYATGIGPWKANLVATPRAPDAGLQWLVASPLLSRALAAGLLVHPWTLRAEAPFLTPLGNGERVPVADEAALLLRWGVSGYFIDQPDVGVAARDAFVAARR